MPPVRNLLAAALLGLGLLFHPLLPAAEAPSAAAVQKSLDGLAERQLAEAEQQALRQVLESTLQQLAEKADSEQKLAELRKQLAEAPRQVLEAQRELARLKDSALPDVPRLYAERPVEELEQLLAERNA
jgi:potassium efflux system protein